MIVFNLIHSVAISWIGCCLSYLIDIVLSLSYHIINIFYKINDSKFITNSDLVMHYNDRIDQCQTTIEELMNKIKLLEDEIILSRKFANCKCTTMKSMANVDLSITSNGHVVLPPPPPPFPVSSVNIDNFKFIDSSTPNPVFLSNGKCSRKNDFKNVDNDCNLHPMLSGNDSDNEMFMKRKKQRQLLKEDLIEQKKILRKIAFPLKQVNDGNNPFDPNTGNEHDLHDILKTALKRKFEGTSLNESILTDENSMDVSM